MGEDIATMGMVCCAEYCAFTALNSVCSCLNGNFGYPLIVLLFTVMGLVFRFDDSAQGSLNWLADYGGFKGCDHVDSDVKNLCLVTQFVLRGGFSLHAQIPRTRSHVRCHALGSR